MIAPSLVVGLVEVPLAEIGDNIRVDMARVMIEPAAGCIHVVVDEELAEGSAATTLLDRLKILLEVHSSYMGAVSVQAGVDVEKVVVDEYLLKRLDLTNEYRECAQLGLEHIELLRHDLEDSSL